jgi:hypothetical protein
LGNVHLFQDLLYTLNRPLSLGHWQTLLRHTLRPYANHRERLMVPELFDFYYRVTDSGNVKAQGQTVRIIQGFIEERNEEAHHRNRSQASAFQQRTRLPELQEKLDQLLSDLRFLARYPWLFVEHAEYSGGQWHYRANYASGANYPFRQQTWKTPLSINSHRCLLMSNEKRAVLELDPFVIVTSQGRIQQPDIFFFDGLFSSGRAGFMNHHIGDYIDRADEGTPASLASDSAKSLLRLLENRGQSAAEKAEDFENQPLPAEIYLEAMQWAMDHGERQTISLDALRRIMNLPREEALGLEREVESQRGMEIEPEAEVPFEGEPSWANLAYYVLDKSNQEEMYYVDIANEARALRDQCDPNWIEGDSAHVEGTISHTLSQDPRFYKLRRGYYRLTKQNELLSNPSWANLAYFVLKRYDPKRRGLHLTEITNRATALKEKHSNWQRDSAETPSHTVSATMGADHRFESMPKRGFWRLTDGEQAEVAEAGAAPRSSSGRQEAYEKVLERLSDIGDVNPLRFGRTYYDINGIIHLMFRYSKAHQRNNEIEYFLGVTPQYFERIHSAGHGFLVFVLGTPDNVLFVPTEDFAEWVAELEPSGSGTWPIAFYQDPEQERIERWAPGRGREDVTVYRNAYSSLQRVLKATRAGRDQGFQKRIGIPDLLESDRLRPGDTIYARKSPEHRATIINAESVEYQGRRWTYNDWGKQVTGWSAINIYREFIVQRTGQTLDELRNEIERG